jgi:CcmD family protein
MSGFVIAYGIVWLGVVGYVARLGAEQRRLSRALEALRWEASDSKNPAQSGARAAYWPSAK